MAFIQTMKWFVIACLLVACGELDPVSVKSLCVGDGVFDEQCPQCQMMPFASQCPQCQQSGVASDTCAPPEMTNPSSQADGGSTPTSTSEMSPDGTTPDSGSNPAKAGNGGPNPGEMGGAGGSGGRNPPVETGGAGAGAAGATPQDAMPKRCTGDPDCTSPGAPACRDDGFCIECVTDEHCPGRQCDKPTNRCVDCVDDPICQTQGKVCNVDLRKCVQCRDASNCSGDTPACSAAQECVQCVTDPDCPDATPACDGMKCFECRIDQNCNSEGKHACIEAEHKCVECKTEAHCRGVSGRPLCATDENACVECLEDADCSDRGASHCDPGSHTCVPCSSHAQCAQFAGTAPRCVSNECVACDEEGGICNGKACILSEGVCSTKPRKSVQACGECVTSDECAAGYVCVNVKFSNGYDTGDFCLPNLPDFDTCPRPFGRKVSGARTLDGVKVQTLCALPETTTCQALVDTLNKKSCSGNNTACGLGASVLAGTNDGRCPGTVCTYSCTGPEFCPNSMICSEERVCL